jgi:hypothetical protein
MDRENSALSHVGICISVEATHVQWRHNELVLDCVNDADPVDVNWFEGPAGDRGGASECRY